MPFAVLARAVPGRHRISAPQLAGLSFLGLVALGTLGFRLLPGLTVGPGLGWIDALFMATSAVCVTGLVVRDVSQEFTLWGQTWLLFLIQAGGLGILTLAGLIVASLGGRLSLMAEEGAAPPRSVLPPIAAAQMLRTAVVFTFTVEALGAMVLWILWRPEYGGAGAAWLAVFHTVSAFCNAGFSLFTDSLVGFRDQPALVLAFAGLIVTGGLGFPVVQDLRSRLRGRQPGLTLHSRLVLGSTLVVLGLSTLLYLALEWDHALEPLGAVHRVTNAFFMAVTARTAGFNTVDYDVLSNPSVLLTLGLMWVGGAPASVAGGVKITTAALLVLVLWARLRGDRRVSLGSRTVPSETVERAAGLAAGAVLLLAVFAFLMLYAELSGGGDEDRGHFVRLVFETQSAFSTVGLSMGVTSELGPMGRILLVPLMLLGRVGPLVVLSAIVVQQRRHVDFRYAHEDVLIG